MTPCVFRPSPAVPRTHRALYNRPERMSATPSPTETVKPGRIETATGTVLQLVVRNGMTVHDTTNFWLIFCGPYLEKQLTYRTL